MNRGKQGVLLRDRVVDVDEDNGTMTRWKDRWIGKGILAISKKTEVFVQFCEKSGI